MQLADHELERTINGSLLLLSDDLQLPLIRKLTVACFNNDEQRNIFAVMQKMATDGLEITGKSLTAQIKSIGDEESCGGMKAIETTINSGIMTGKLNEYVNRIKEYQVKRRLQQISMEIINMLGDHCSVEYILQAIDNKIKELDISDSEHYCLKQCLDDFANRVKDRKKKTGIVPEWMPESISKLFPDGITTGALLLIQAKSSHGKSTLAAQTAYELADKGKNVLYITCEDGRYIFGMRTACNLTGKTHKELLNMKERITSLFDDLPDFVNKPDNFTIECSTTNWLEIERLILSTNLRVPLDLVVIDYLQLLSNGGGVDQKTLDLESIVRGAKTLAMKLQTVFIMVSQEKEDGSAKWVSAAYDLADAVFSIKPEEPADLKSDKNDILVKIVVMKNKVSGGQGYGKLIWHRPIFKFEPYVAPKKVVNHSEFINNANVSDYE
jgi:replicative DNA helicase